MDKIKINLIFNEYNNLQDIVFDYLREFYQNKTN